ncbi:MAG: hypothetical protein JSU59_06385 [Nitrospirota bacterium]|nr:MAG: hypothetical protein JSU59_06385 [Nitrospirota bacterium]
MKKILGTMRAKFVDGFFILLPVLLAYLMLGQLFDGLMALTQPIVDVLPTGLFSDLWTHRLVAAMVLVVLFVVVGLMANTAIAGRIGNWFERAVLNRFPPYQVLKNLARWISGKNVPGQLHPALLHVTPEIRILVAIVEELPGGDLTVFVPLAPTPGVGMLQIVSGSKVQKLECRMTDALGWNLNWGMGTDALFKTSKESR